MSKLLSMIHRHAQTQAGKPALTGDDGVVLYGELPSLIAKRAQLLADTGCKVAGLSLDNGPEWILWDLACIQANVVCVPLPGFFSPGQKAHAIKAAGVGAIITAGGIADTGNREAAALPANTSKITFTSGTTGTPKGVCLSQAGMESVAQSLLDAVGAEYAVRHFSVLPLSILLENIAGAYTALLAGSTCFAYSLAGIGFSKPFSPDFPVLAASLRRHEATSAILVPELLRGLVRHMALQRQSLPSLRFVAVGGAKVDASLLLRARKAGLPAYEGYGLSECGSVVTLNTPAADMPGTSGKVLRHIDLHLGPAGEIIINNPAFLGYTDGAGQAPFHTGDTGSIDEQGFVTIQGRIKNVLVTSYGRNISPEWVESVLLAQPEIAQAFVYGDAQPYPRALLVPASRNADIAAALARANSSLPSYARISVFHAVAPFSAANNTLTANGRLRRTEILHQYASLVIQEDYDVVLQSAG